MSIRSADRFQDPLIFLSSILFYFLTASLPSFWPFLLLYLPLLLLFHLWRHVQATWLGIRDCSWHGPGSSSQQMPSFSLWHSSGFLCFPNRLAFPGLLSIPHVSMPLQSCFSHSPALSLHSPACCVLYRPSGKQSSKSSSIHLGHHFLWFP